MLSFEMSSSSGLPTGSKASPSKFNEVGKATLITKQYWENIVLFIISSTKVTGDLQKWQFDLVLSISTAQVYQIPP
jgi:hypothetical protein